MITILLSTVIILVVVIVYVVLLFISIDSVERWHNKIIAAIIYNAVAIYSLYVSALMLHIL